MIAVFVWIVIVAAVAGLIMWALTQVAPPDPIGRVARVVVVCIAVLVIIGLAASLFGVDVGLPRP